MPQDSMPHVTICDTNEMPFEEVRRGRVHTIRRKRLPLDSGLPGVTMEYSLSVVPDGYFTPRHRHNFDQIRYTLSGIQSTGLGDLAAGEVGYFPEGSYYGPQKQDGECECLVLQFQGASGEHLLSNEEMNATYDKLIKAGGKFENGVYKGFKPDGSPKNRDSYEAIWETHEGRELEFPPPRYRDPVMMLSKNYRFWPDRKRPGIEAKHLGTFSEARTGISFLRLAPGAAIRRRRAGGRRAALLHRPARSATTAGPGAAAPTCSCPTARARRSCAQSSRPSSSSSRCRCSPTSPRSAGRPASPIRRRSPRRELTSISRAASPRTRNQRYSIRSSAIEKLKCPRELVVSSSPNIEPSGIRRKVYFAWPHTKCSPLSVTAEANGVKRAEFCVTSLVTSGTPWA